MLRRPEMTAERIEQIRQTIKANPGWSRWRISRHLCEQWDWRVPGGAVKDISCRDLLNSLEKAGVIKLPAPKNAPYMNRRPSAHLKHDTTPIESPLKQLYPLRVETVKTGSSLAEFKSLLAQYHYLGFDRTVGENMKYIVRSSAGATLAVLLFGSAAWSCQSRDKYIGWATALRRERLQLITNNTRFLIPPWVRVPHLASHTLALITRRISHDWQLKYGHPLFLLETFVESGRFRGTCYRAANWVYVGETAGRGRNDRQRESELPRKDVYLIPLAHNWQKALTHQG